MGKQFYLDAASNTPLDERVFEEMKPYLVGYAGNSFSIHEYGVKAMLAIDNARDCIAKAIGCEANEIYFNSGATEGNNTVLKGLYFLNHAPFHRHKIVISCFEHASIMAPANELNDETGMEIVYVYPKNGHNLTSEDFLAEIDEDTLLVCLMAVNNETGANYSKLLQDIAKFAHEVGALVLSDCTQYFSMGKNVPLLNEGPLKDVDYITMSSHKIHGPMGVGALIVRNNAPIPKLISGGAQENGQRGGTSNVPGIIGFAKAIELMRTDKHLPEEIMYLENLFTQAVYKLNSKYKDIQVVSTLFPGEEFYPNILNFRLEGDKVPKDLFLADALINAGIACSAGAACGAGAEGIKDSVGSHVLRGMGLTDVQIMHTVRISISHMNTMCDMAALISALEKIMEECYEKAKQNI